MNWHPKCFFSVFIIINEQVTVVYKLRRILKIFWANKSSNSELHKRCEQELIEIEVKRKN